LGKKQILACIEEGVKRMKVKENRLIQCPESMIPKFKASNKELPNGFNFIPKSIDENGNHIYDVELIGFEEQD
jgi:hypothetical protein